MKVTELDVSFESLSKAFSRLREGINENQTQIEKDGVIQRFEFTFELLWKTLKLLLNESGVEVRSPRECFREGFKRGIIVSDTIFLDMLEDRNNTVHAYSEIESTKIYSRIKMEYIDSMQALIEKIKEHVQRTNR